MHNLLPLLPWLAFAVSLASLFIAASAFWTSREKLRLDLYNRRFDVYSRALDYAHSLDDWIPTDAERASHSLQDSADLERTKRAFIKASRESQFLFKDTSGVHKLLEQMHADSFGIIGHRRDVAPNLGPLGPDALPLCKEFDKRVERFHASIGALEQAMSKYLDFHAVASWR
jgi:hypothetical protein